MGYNATVVVLLDRLDEIERDPDFGKKLAAAIRYRASFPTDDKTRPGYRYAGAEATGQTQVIEVHHAAWQMVVTVGGNTGRVLGYGGGYVANDDTIIKCLNDDRLRRKREAKRCEAAE